jgi:hypothetical protein
MCYSRDFAASGKRAFIFSVTSLKGIKGNLYCMSTVSRIPNRKKSTPRAFVNQRSVQPKAKHYCPELLVLFKRNWNFRRCFPLGAQAKSLFSDVHAPPALTHDQGSTNHFDVGHRPGAGFRCVPLSWRHCPIHHGTLTAWMIWTGN